MLATPAEIGFRMASAVKKRIELRTPRRTNEGIPSLNPGMTWRPLSEQKNELRDIVIASGPWSEGKAKDLMDHRFTFFAFHRKSLGPRIDWHSDGKRDLKPPMIFSKNIDYQDIARYGDFKYIWEINRHQHLVSLAKAFFITGKAEYKNEVFAQLSDWILMNPTMKGINWTSPLELGLRLISWSWVWLFLKDELDAELGKAWVNCVYDHCRQIGGNFSRYSSANNHLIGEAAGLFIASLTWPFGEESESWSRISREILEEEIQKQTHEDGVNKEQAVSYQQFVMDFFLLAGLLAEKKGDPFSREYWKAFQKMLDYLGSIMDMRGNIPQIGDSDNGYAVLLADGEAFDPYRSLLASGAILFKRGDLKQKSGGIDEKTLWLLGPEGALEYQNLEGIRFAPRKEFRSGGYFILSSEDNREDEIKCIFDCGPLGYAPLAAHGHSDALSVLLTVKGKPILIDPGTYVYHSPGEWRDYFRGTSAHNTLRIDEKNQSTIGGDYMWLRKAGARLIEWMDSEDLACAEGEHFGYRSWKEDLVHQRRVVLKKKERVIEIYDRIRARRSHRVEQFFHFDEGCEVDRTGRFAWGVRQGDVHLEFRMDPGIESSLYRGSRDPLAGWSSTKFDVKRSSPTIIGRAVVTGPSSFKTVIAIQR